jgi:hypothetical protein
VVFGALAFIKKKKKIEGAKKKFFGARDLFGKNVNGNIVSIKCLGIAYKRQSTIPYHKARPQQKLKNPNLSPRSQKSVSPEFSQYRVEFVLHVLPHGPLESKTT